MTMGNAYFPGASSGTSSGLQLGTGTVASGVVAGGGGTADVSINDLPSMVLITSITVTRTAGTSTSTQAKLYFGNPMMGTDLGLVLGAGGGIDVGKGPLTQTGPQRYAITTMFAIPYPTFGGRCWFRVVNNDTDSEYTIDLTYLDLT